MKEISDFELLRRAFKIKLVARVSEGEVRMPWYSDVKLGRIVSGWGDFYAVRPCSLNKDLFGFEEYRVKPEIGPITNLKKIDEILTFHPYHERSFDKLSATLGGILRQIPDEFVEKTSFVEIFDSSQSKNIVYVPEYKKKMQYVGVRLLGLEEGAKIDPRIKNQPVMLTSKQVISKRQFDMLEDIHNNP